MKFLLLLSLLPTYAWSASIALEIFDQSKLEALLRMIPSSLVSTETYPGYIRKYHQFPRTKNNGFVIKCYADYFGTSEIPSFKLCEVTVSKMDIAKDEILLRLTDDSEAAALYSAISYGQELKKFYSNERVYGQSYDGKYRDLFRYTFFCKASSCDVTFATKKASF